MPYDKRSASKELTMTLAYSLLFCGAIAMPGAVYYTGRALTSLTSLLLLLPTFYFMQLRRQYNVFKFFLMHFLVIIATFYATNYFFGSDTAFIYAATVLCFAVFSVICYASPQKIKFTGIFIALMIILFVAGSYFTYRTKGILLDLQLSFLATAIIACYLLNTSMSGIDSVLEEVSDSTIAPSESIIKFNNKVTGLLICAMCAVIMISRFLFIDKLLVLLYTGLDRLIYFIYRLFSRFRSDSGGVAELAPDENFIFPTVPDFVTSNVSNREYKNPEPGNNIFMNIMFGIAIFCLLFAILGLAYVLYRKFKDMPALIKRERYSDDVKTFVSSEKEPFFNKSRALPIIGLTYSERTRRLFIIKIRKYGDHDKIKFARSDTSGQMSKKIKKIESIDNLNNLYGKARYSTKEVSKGEYEHVKIYN